MRSRKQIEETFKDIMVPTGMGHIKTELEILLDIRELLLEERQEKEFQRIIEERKLAQEDRLSKLKVDNE